jgi:hypothetical protein
MRALLAFGCLVMLGCAPGSDQPQYTADGSLPNPIGTPGGGSLGDGGVDAGRDAGPDAGDAGCVGTSFVTAFVTDNCIIPGTATSATVFVDSTSCQVTMTVTDGLNCSGLATTASNAFDGGCGALYTPCTSSSLPGMVTCKTSGTGTCTVQICDSSGHCPP